MPRPFLTTRWTNVVLVNYRVPAELLPPPPAGSELDTPESEPDLHLLSLVALQFTGTRVLGIPIPTARTFPELNLRYYVRSAQGVGGVASGSPDPLHAVIFLREFVPSRLIVLGARLFYHQPYHLAHLRHDISVSQSTIEVATDFRWREQAGTIRLRARNEPQTPAPDSIEHFLKEHYWGFDRARSGKGFRYRVEHPIWRTYPVEEADVTIDPGALLGSPWRDLDWPAALHSIIFAEGSPVTVYTAEHLCRDH